LLLERASYLCQGGALLEQQLETLEANIDPRISTDLGSITELLVLTSVACQQLPHHIDITWVGLQAAYFLPKTTLGRLHPLVAILIMVFVRPN
jgi:hypothetical protein